MPTRFQQLRSAVANLAASPDEQVRYLDQLFTPLTGGGSAAGYGNDELVEELYDIFPAADDMIEHGELTEAEKAAIRPLDDLVSKLCCKEDADFWKRDALFQDPRWTEVRACAARSLEQLPDENGRSADRPNVPLPPIAIG